MPRRERPRSLPHGRAALRWILPGQDRGHAEPGDHQVSLTASSAHLDPGTSVTLRFAPVLPGQQVLWGKPEGGGDGDYLVDNRDGTATYIASMHSFPLGSPVRCIAPPSGACPRPPGNHREAKDLQGFRSRLQTFRLPVAVRWLTASGPSLGPCSRASNGSASSKTA